MADNVELNAGSGGATILTDDCTTGQAQIIKLAISADGDATLIPADAANGIDVDVTRSALPSGAATSAKQDTLIGHVDGIETLLTKSPVTPASPAAISVGVASAEAVAANANRRGLILTNTSQSTISLGFAAAAVLLSGVTLFPGGIFTMDDRSLTTGAINAIAGAASSNLAVQEFS